MKQLIRKSQLHAVERFTWGFAIQISLELCRQSSPYIVSIKVHIAHSVAASFYHSTSCALSCL